jgi:hypothetical protein
MAPIKRIARFLRNQTGILYNPLLSSATRPGMIVDIDSLLDVDWRASLTDFGVPAIEAVVESANLPHLSKLKGMKFGGNARMDLAAELPVSGGLEAAFEQSTSIRMQFGDAEMHRLPWLALSRAIAEALRGDQARELEQFLREDDHHIVVASYYAPLRVSFEREGQVGFDFKAEVASAGSGGLSAGWTWKTNAAVESEDPVLFGYETARWDFKRSRLRETMGT